MTKIEFISDFKAQLSQFLISEFEKLDFEVTNTALNCIYDIVNFYVNCISTTTEFKNYYDDDEVILTSIQHKLLSQISNNDVTIYDYINWPKNFYAIVKNLYKTDDEFKKKLNLDRYNDMFSKNADGYFKYVWYSHLQHIILDFCKKFIVDKNTF